MRRFRTLGRLVTELFQFMAKDKLWWMFPVIMLLLAMSLFLIVAEGSALAPLIYAMF